MKLLEQTVEVVSNITFDETVEMGIGHDAVPLIIERLISAYDKPALAALREYTSNAYDVHVLHGVDRPVEVDLPGPLSPTLRVRDYGVGLSREELKGFGQFGTSTKRDSNALTGGFGIGSKSGLAVSSQFTVTSIKDGIRNTVIISRDADNRPHMNFLPESESSDESGTTITIPMSDRFVQGSLNSFFLGWKPGSILVDGEVPKRSVYNEDVFRPVGDFAWQDLSGDTSSRDSIRILINQVLYEIEYKNVDLSFNERNNLKNYVVKVDNGSVKISPSRESIIFDKNTRTVVAERLRSVLVTISDDLVKDVENAKTMHDALYLRDMMARTGFPVNDLTWNGRPIHLPGMTIDGEKVPDTEGTWANPERSTARSGWTVRKHSGVLSSLSLGTSYQKRVLVFGAPQASLAVQRKYGSPSSYVHAESLNVGEWLSTLETSITDSFRVFITSESLENINYWYRNSADIVISAAALNDAAKNSRAARGVAAEKPSEMFRVLLGTMDGVGDYRDMTAEEISSEYDSIIVLSREPNFQRHVLAVLTTKSNFERRASRSVMRLVRSAKSALIVLKKGESIDPVRDLLPPEVTIEDLALADIKKNAPKKSKDFRRAASERDLYPLYVLDRLSIDDIKRIKNKDTRRHVRSYAEASGFNLDSLPVSSDLEWMRFYLPSIGEAYDFAVNANKLGKLTYTPLKNTYPLLSNLEYKTPAMKVVDYINLLDSMALDNTKAVL